MKNISQPFNQLVRLIRSHFLIFSIYLLLPYIFFAVGTNIFDIPLAPGDGWVGGVPLKIFSASLSAWNPFLQGGTFSFKDIGFQSLYLPGIIVMRVFPNVFGYNLLLLAHYSMAGFFTFLFLKEMKLNHIASFSGGLVFMFSGFLSAHQGHTSMLMTASYLPVVLYFFESFMGSKKIITLFLTAVAFALSISADYTAVSMYIGMVTFPYIVFRVLIDPESKNKTVVEKLGSAVLYSSIVFILGLMLAAVQILPILESLKLITREKISFDFFASYSFPIRMLPILIFPFFFGIEEPSFYQPGYFGEWNLTEMAGYMGILPPIFAILGFFYFRKKSKHIFFWAATSLVAFVLVLGDTTPIYKLLYRVPVYNMFRAPARNWLEVNFAIAVLASCFVHYFIVDNQIKKQVYLRWTYTITVVLSAIVLFILTNAESFAVSPEKKQLLSENIRFVSPALYIPLVIIFFSVVMLYLLFNNRHSKAFWALITVTVFFDLFSFGHFHNATNPGYKIFRNEPNQVANFISTDGVDKTQYRIFGLNAEDQENQVYPDISVLYGFNTINAYSNVWLKDYADLTKFVGNGVTPEKRRLLENSKVISILSTKYIITSNQADKDFLRLPLANTSPPLIKIIADGFHNGAWYFWTPESITDQSVILKSKGPGQVSLIQIPFDINPDTNYQVSFKARRPVDAPSDGSSTNSLIVDLNGENYDNPDQEAVINSNIAINEFEEFYFDFNSGSTTPDQASLRFFTLSTTPYEIKDIKFIQTSGGIPYWGEKLPPGRTFPLYAKKFESPDGIAVYENMNFLPRARFVKRIKVVKSSNDAINALWENDKLDPSKTALVEGYTGKWNFEEGEVISADYSNYNAVHLSVSSGETSFLVLSDSWYPGWKAFVDDKETRIYKTNAVSRGILIEGAGRHEVELRFVPLSFYLGLGITSLTLLGIGVLSYRKREAYF